MKKLLSSCCDKCASVISESVCFLREKKIKKGKYVPKHVAIIMDGNRRWEKKRNAWFRSSSKSGHQSGAEAVLNIIPVAKKIGIRILTLFTFSTENWQRSPEEVTLIFSLLTDYLKRQVSYMVGEGIRLRCLGDYSELPRNLQEAIEMAVHSTRNMTDMDLNLAINYGSKNELVRAFGKMHSDIIKKKLNESTIDENLVNSYLDTQGMEEPELLIRTSGELRISNFLLWQIAYTELYFTKTLWPDFAPKDLLKAIASFQARIRRRGK
ncbi:MAG: polyprenyl diphosphate synthase [Victivallaceae bacterium]